MTPAAAEEKALASVRAWYERHHPHAERWEDLTPGVKQYHYELFKSAFSAGAESMRGRCIELVRGEVEPAGYYVESIRALPLIPEGKS